LISSNRKRNLVVFLLCLFCGIIAERAIPHSHIEKDGILVPDFSSKINHYSHDAEELHSMYYESVSFDNLDISTPCIVSFLLFDIYVQFDKQICINNYNILPKILSSILFIVHLYSSKAPPFIN
jgi:hypothetical protein